MNSPMLRNIAAGSPAKMFKCSPEPIPYSTEALEWDLQRVREAWDKYQTSRDRDGIYGYLDRVHELVTWWMMDREADVRTRRALQLQNGGMPADLEPFAAIIWCTSNPNKVDGKTRSKWSRVLRYSAKYKSSPIEPLIRIY